MALLEVSRVQLWRASLGSCSADPSKAGRVLGGLQGVRRRRKGRLVAGRALPGMEAWEVAGAASSLPWPLKVPPAHPPLPAHAGALPPHRHYDLDQLLDPRSVTSDPLDYRLSWHLWEVLRALNFTHLGQQSQGVLTVGYAAQLESEGLWEWSIFILLHQPDPR